jgi:malonate-semialdehyde dehydrogenase (acetylating) / methylmalonate-semialdehyde dehydrogenase
MNQIKKMKYFINGQWLTSTTSKYMDIFNPSTGEELAQVPCCTADEVNAAIASANSAFP